MEQEVLRLRAGLARQKAGIAQLERDSATLRQELRETHHLVAAPQE